MTTAVGADGGLVAGVAPDLRMFVRPGDTVLWGQGAGEPRTLTEALVHQRAGLGRVNVFLGATYSDTLRPEHADHLNFLAIGGIGRNAGLAQAGVLEIVPCHLSALPALIMSGRLPVDVVFVQVSPVGPSGCHSLGLVADYVRPAMQQARTVLAEVNDQVPYTLGDSLVRPEELHHVVRTSRPPVFVPTRRVGADTRRIGHLSASFVPDGSVVQLGIGGVAPAVAAALHGKRDLGIHCGIVGDWLVDLYGAGSVTNARKSLDRGISVTGAISGTRRLYDFVGDNPAVELRPVSYTHDPGVLGRLDNLVAVNSAVEVDLTGQVNAETLGGNHIGAVGGQVDFVRAATSSASGRSIIALPSTSKRGQVSRIVSRLADGVVTTPRSDADLIVTEHGVADLRGVPLAERARRLIAIADPKFRSQLAEFVRRTEPMC